MWKMPHSADLQSASDETLAVLARSSVDAEAVLLSRYLKIVRFHANRYAHTAADADDLAQEGLIALLHVISQYDETQGHRFSTFAQACIVNRMRSLAKRGNAMPVENLLQVMETQGELVDPDTPESIFLEKENYARCRMQVMALLSAREWEILQHILDGESYAEAADGLQISVKSVDNAMQRIRRKMRAVRSTEYFGK
jgi:RNA polymerase sporulation-specific sigma factor